MEKNGYVHVVNTTNMITCTCDTIFAAPSFKDGSLKVKSSYFALGLHSTCFMDSPSLEC